MDSTAPPRLSLTLALVVISWFAWVAFQTTQLASERAKLQQVKASQELAFQQSVKTRAEIDSIAGDTARLAALGNAGAQVVVAELRKRGITLDPNARTIPPGGK